MFSEHALAQWDPEPFKLALQRAGYTGPKLDELGLKSLPDPFARVAVITRTFPEDSPISIACRLFDAGEPVPGLQVMAVFGQHMEGLLRLGLLEPLGGDLVRSVAKLAAEADGWFASDHPAALLSEKTDYTMGIGMSTRLLAALIPARPGAAALDLCTGAGWVAMGLAEAGCEVTAADLNSRALGFARFNARLAGCRPITWVAGDLFDPVAGHRFDVIACNPPFVISPECTFTYRDSGSGGDSLCERVARRMPEFLIPDGIGVMLLNWYDDGRDESSTRPLDWMAGSGCGTWLFRAMTHGPAEYAQSWLRDSGRGRAPAPELMDRWMAHFREIGARRIHSGFLVIHRGDGTPWSRTDARSLGKLETPAGGEVRRVAEGQAWLASRQPSEEALLEARFTVPEGVHARTDLLLDRGWGARTIRLMSPAELSYNGQIDEFMLRLLALCREGKPPADMVAELRASPQFARSTELAPQVAGLVRELIGHGMLVPREARLIRCGGQDSGCDHPPPCLLAGVKKKFFPLFALLAACNMHAEDAAAVKTAPAYVDEAPLPQGWPKPGPYDQVTEKKYPAYRAAFTNGKGETSAFWTLFSHIKRNDIPMTAPVEMAMDGQNKQASMAFLYQNGKVGTAGPDGTKVEVRDVPATLTLSYTWQGNDSKENISKAKTALETELNERKKEAKGFRLLGYNGPGTPRAKRTWELQALLE